MPAFDALQFAGKFGFEVKVCHVNHCLRGAAADADEEYVKKLCGELGVECRVSEKKWN